LNLRVDEKLIVGKMCENIKLLSTSLLPTNNNQIMLENNFEIVK
jgi:hypothetical protein